jgi:hypothetical protein
MARSDVDVDPVEPQLPGFHREFRDAEGVKELGIEDDVHVFLLRWNVSFIFAFGPPSRMLKNPFSPRLLKRAQMQGGKRWAE